MPKSKHITQCASCGRRVRHDHDFIRAHFVGKLALWHWRYWLAELRQQETAWKEMDRLLFAEAERR